MKVVIITEGYQSTGYGHITRCLSLYQAFKEKEITPAIIVNGDKEAEHFLADSNYEMFNWLDYQEVLYSKIGEPDIVIVDSYKTDEKFYSDLYPKTKLLAAIDDNNRMNYKAHVVINGTIGSENYSYNRENDIKYLLGAGYIPLRREFWNLDEREINSAINNVLITLGGQDIRNLTQPILDYFLDKAPYLNYYIVAKENFNIDFKKYTTKDRVKFIFDADASKMKELMMNCDIAISAAGQTIYELARTGTPSIAVIVADNQIKNLHGWVKNGFLAEELYWNDKSLLEKIAGNISKLKDPGVRKQKSTLGRNTINGGGAVRIANQLIDFITDSDIFYFRKAMPDDAGIVFELSNDPVVRANSINSGEIVWDEHVSWFGKKIAEENHIYLLYFSKDNRFIGQVRFNVESRKAVVSISITNDFRGKNLANKMLKSACINLLSERPEVNEIHAYIKPANAPSINGFLKAEFIFSSVETINKELYNLYIYKR